MVNRLNWLFSENVFGVAVVWYMQEIVGIIGNIKGHIPWKLGYHWYHANPTMMSSLVAKHGGRSPNGPSQGLPSAECPIGMMRSHAEDKKANLQFPRPSPGRPRLSWCLPVSTHTISVHCFAPGHRRLRSWWLCHRYDTPMIAVYCW